MGSRLRQLLKNEKGFTLLELIVSIALLALIVGAMLNAFVASTKTNITSGAIINEGYIAQDCMEKIYSLSLSKNIAQLCDVLVTETFAYEEVGGAGSGLHQFKKGIDSYYVKIEIKKNPYIGAREEVKRVIVEVFKDNTYTNPVALVQNYIIIK